MAEIPRLRQSSGSGKFNKKMDTKTVSVSENSFIVDLGSYHHISPDSTMILPRSFSRKGHHRGASDSTSSLLSATSPSSSFSSRSSSPSSPSPSPRGQIGPSNMQEKPTATSEQQPIVVIAVGPSDEQATSHHHHHQITVKTGSILPLPSSTSPTESQMGRRRSSLPWYSHPKRVLLFFATISSIGTLFLICFTLAINKPYSSSDSQA